MQTKSIEKDFQRQSGWETFESWIIQNCPAEKCLGNTVVPQIPAYLWALVKAALWA
jgi:hypothetical protein